LPAPAQNLAYPFNRLPAAFLQDWHQPLVNVPGWPDPSAGAPSVAYPPDRRGAITLAPFPDRSDGTHSAPDDVT